jgi:hypothetical protein
MRLGIEDVSDPPCQQAGADNGLESSDCLVSELCHIELRCGSHDTPMCVILGIHAHVIRVS